MNNILLLNYQIEYENSPHLTIDDICTKYNTQKEKLEGHTSWVKKPELIEHTPAIELDDIIVLPDEKPIANDGKKFNRIALKDDLNKAKELIVKNAIEILTDEINDISIKEFKDVVSIIDTIDKNEFGDKSAPTTINNTQILVNNMLEKYSG